MPRQWINTDDIFLRHNYPTNTAQWCADILCRSKNAIHIRARMLGIKAVGRCGCRRTREILRKLDNGFVICLCPKHGETKHKFCKDGHIVCVACSKMYEGKRRGNRVWTDRTRELARLSTRRQRATPLGKYKNRIRVALKQCSLGRISFSKHLPYNAEQLCDYLENIRHKQNNRCPVCMNSYDYVQDSIDHIVPVSVASTEDELLSLFSLKNLSLLCLKCNSAKGDRV